MSIIPDPEEVTDYVLKRQRELPEDEQVVFHIRPLTQRQFSMITRRERYGAAEVVKAACSGWTGAIDVKFSQAKIDEMLPGDVVELSDRILVMSKITPDEEGN